MACCSSLEMSEWRGQNQRTLVVGWFPASLVVPPPPPTVSNSSAAATPASSSGFNPVTISAPLKGSLHHTGHGDLKPQRSWGTPENLDEWVDQCDCSEASLIYSDWLDLLIWPFAAEGTGGRVLPGKRKAPICIKWQVRTFNYISEQEEEEIHSRISLFYLSVVFYISIYNICLSKLN